MVKEIHKSAVRALYIWRLVTAHFGVLTTFSCACSLMTKSVENMYVGWAGLLASEQPEQERACTSVVGRPARARSSPRRVVRAGSGQQQQLG